ncbi:MAG: 30S ribosomal protein S20 [Bacteroidia bacterium]|nr:30S ribosomal protein S20 [Bacteroidia bacterium]
MANHKSAEKRIRANDSKRLRNRYYTKTARTAIKDLRTETDKKKAQTELPKITSMLDKLAKKNVIHKNKAANIKSKLTRFVNTLGAAKK